ncbi:hypothetical protein OWR29_13370 [Actinoplanes sp. Pm04-4]|uniref:Nucleoside phosphorylase domain-containing protein n=1 Tax=Paractinoplanes pyxinae TaxID=2997416 RepID=A0ABT4AXM5_9ACTN|nr:hypothetical protein [Actinoplanes pyxinae]MCY1138993.1 hypothetical protein [Actinoplanes pyxinae]
MAALPVELGALIEVVDDVRTYKDDDDPNDYRLGRIPSGTAGQFHSVVLLIPPRDGTQLAATCCAHMLRTFPNIRTVIMTGIAGGIPRPRQPHKHVRLGDIVVAHEGIVNYGSVRREDGTTSLRGPQGAGSISLQLVQAMNELRMAAGRGDRRWEHWLDPVRSPRAAEFPRPSEETDILYARGYPTAHPPRPESDTPANMPRVHYGVIGSSDTLMADEDLRDELASEFPSMYAVEMEGVGVAAGTSLIGKSWFMVRSVADYCERTGKNDSWHPYASYVAAAYVRALLGVAKPVRVSPAPQKASPLPLVDDTGQQALDAILRKVPADLDIEPVWQETLQSHANPGPQQVPNEPPHVPAEAFHSLASRNAGASGLSPAIVFLAYLAEVIRPTDTGLADRLDAWIADYTRDAGVDEALRARLRSGSGARPVAPGAGPALVIELAVDGINRRRFRVTSFIQEHAGPWRPRRLTVDDITEQQIEEAVSRHIDGAERTWAELRTKGQAGIEFVLPTSMINLPVQWYRTLRMDDPEPICVLYEVAVRSGERMRAHSVRRDWINRWERLEQQPFTGQVQWGTRYSFPQASVESWSHELSGNDRRVVVVLSAPPDDELGARELRAALKAGVPIILWDQRPRQAPADTKGNLEDLTENPSSLPAHLKVARVEAARREVAEPHHYGRSVALLWDDPTRLVDDGGGGRP